MSEHKHTDECLAYAAKTGKAYCIAPCADAYQAAVDAAALRDQQTEDLAYDVYLCEQHIKELEIDLRIERASHEEHHQWQERISQQLANMAREKNVWQVRAETAEARLDVMLAYERDQLTAKRGPR